MQLRLEFPAKGVQCASIIEQRRQATRGRSRKRKSARECSYLIGATRNNRRTVGRGTFAIAKELAALPRATQHASPHRAGRGVGARVSRRIMCEDSCAYVQDTAARRKYPRLVSRSGGFRPFISNCGAALSRRASRASWSGRLLDDASDQYRRPASHWPLLLGAVENRPGDDGQEEAGEGGGGGPRVPRR